jgi:hypothetical protein
MAFSSVDIDHCSGILAIKRLCRSTQTLPAPTFAAANPDCRLPEKDQVSELIHRRFDTFDKCGQKWLEMRIVALKFQK